jgi:hypothetical protein
MHWKMLGIPRKLMCFVFYHKERFTNRFFSENTVTGVTYLAMVQTGFFLKWVKIQKTSFSNRTELRKVRCFLNESLPQRWIGRVGKEDLAIQF